MNEFAEDLGMEKPRQRHRFRIPQPQRPISRAGDTFAPYFGPKRCQSISGRWRPEHDFCVERRDGTYCLWCDALRRMEPI
jgi:hypothetical protein